MQWTLGSTSQLFWVIFCSYEIFFGETSTDAFQFFKRSILIFILTYLIIIVATILDKGAYSLLMQPLRIYRFIFLVPYPGLNKYLGSQQRLNVDTMLTYFEIILLRLM